MGNELVMCTMPSEMFSFEHLVVWDEKKQDYVRIRDLHSRDEWWPLRRDAVAIERLHPGAHWRFPITPRDLWEPPAEPHGLGAKGKGSRKLLIRHRNAARAGLEAFINTKLLGLGWMIRTGWWILDEAAVRVVRFTDVPGNPTHGKRSRKTGKRPKLVRMVMAVPGQPMDMQLRQRDEKLMLARMKARKEGKMVPQLRRRKQREL